MNENADDKKLDWMYKGANSLVNREDYLLGKPVDKQLEQLNQEERDKKLGLVPPKNHVEHECIPPSIRDFNKILQVEQVDLSAKLQEDPLVAIRKREEEARRQFLQNPVQLKKLQEAMKAQEIKKTKNKKGKKSKRSDSDSDLDQQIANKLKNLKGNPLALSIAKKEKKRKVKDDSIDIILMHKYNELKDKLSQKDMDDILAGRTSSSSESEDEDRKNAASSSDENKPSIQKFQQDSRSRYSAINKKDNQNKRSSSSSSSEDKKEYKTKEYKKNARRQNRRNCSSEDVSKNKKYIDKKTKNGREDPENRKKGYSKHKDDRRDTSDSTEDESPDRKRVKKEENNRYRRREYKKYSSEERDYHTKKRNTSSSINERNKHSSVKSKLDDKYLKSKEREHKRYSSSEDTSMTKRRYRSNSREPRKSKQKHSASSSEDTENKERRRQAKKHDERNRDSDSDPENSNINSKPTSESELDKIILQKLRMLRNETDKKAKESVETNEAQVYSHYNSDDDEHVYKKKSFGLVRADGTKIMLKGDSQSHKPIETKKVDPPKEPERKRPKKLSAKEKEELRKQMMKDAEYREKERSINLKKFREEDEKEEKERRSKDFDKDFIHKELLKSTKDASVESRIKSKLNNIQRSSRHMTSNFSKRH